MTQASKLFPRRQFLIGSTAMAVGGVSGCGREPAPVAEVTVERQDVPLRLGLVGAEQDADAIRRGWGAVTDHPIDIQSVRLDRSQPDALSSSLVKLARQSDVLIYPLGWIPTLAQAEALADLSDQEIEKINQEQGSLLSALRNGSRYAGMNLAIQLGACLPALLSVEKIGSGNLSAIESWKEYDDLVSSQWDGAATEPSAPGWAAAMFLWRLSGSNPWLFHREDFHPVVEQDAYIQSLELMARTNQKYKVRDQNPGQVWDAVRSGKLMAGIGFPAVRSGDDVEMQIGNPPGVTELSKVLLDLFSPVVSLSTACRQSAVAKRFIQWISGGEGSEDVRRQIPGMTDVRMEGAGGRRSGSASFNSYDPWLMTRLSSPVTSPNLQVHRAGDYYRVLDQQVRRALHGESSPRESLKSVAEQWGAITSEVGVDKQLRAWRRAQGLRG